MDDLELALSIFQLEFNHADLFLLFANFLLADFEDVLLDVGLLVENTQFVVAVNELNTHVVAGLAGLLVLVDEVVHFLLQRVDDQVELV